MITVTDITSKTVVLKWSFSNPKTVRSMYELYVNDIRLNDSVLDQGSTSEVTVRNLNSNQRHNFSLIVVSGSVIERRSEITNISALTGIFLKEYSSEFQLVYQLSDLFY